MPILTVYLTSKNTPSWWLSIAQVQQTCWLAQNIQLWRRKYSQAS